LPSSTRSIAAAAVIGFVIDEIRKIVSRRIGSSAPIVLVPMSRRGLRRADRAR